ncbi:BZ3500_MvSof-1268-A1-R1_Chr1-2g01302 [Microbotryum saponariae]|uniref:BZ3500_MvSof-1268-A1-R1_Chr1-2g01302 protein n=1 Tax=Microbotryum saponariae TaxID=289078 RepID=A0A2X0MXK5_9BASI|nr:BZ3500_MvSof-1268-A1-R1_Chr1-2g01302 [Microbotryum saponariae]SCZ97025.1 BZ3501_MvSof-1269-A2-R1_Chr1-2g00900 [Microbotryum saponariae]
MKVRCANNLPARALLLSSSSTIRPSFVLCAFTPPNRFAPLRTYHSTITPRAQSFIQAGPQIGSQNNFDFRDDAEEEPQRSGRNSSAPRPAGGEGGSGGNGKGKGRNGNGKSWTSGLESAAATGAGIILLAVAGLCYHKWYKWEAFRKMRRAFAKGYDPVLALASAAAYDEQGGLVPGRVVRKEQEYIRKIVNGEISGEYLLLMGPKGVGKTSMIVDAMVNNQADGCAMMEAHEDAEVFRLRLGKALDFEYNEDSFAGLFSRKDPREAGPCLDIERALAKLEKVAISFRKDRGRPMVLVFNNIHFVHDDPEGHALLHMLQQRAESWSQAGVCTVIFSSDDFHVYRHLKKNASRMHVLSIRDLTPLETHTFLRGTHEKAFPEDGEVGWRESWRIWDLIGGRLSYLNRVARRKDMLEAAEEMIEQEKEWLHHRLGLIPDHDDDVMDEQKVSSCSMLLFQHFAKMAEEAEPLLNRNTIDSVVPSPGAEEASEGGAKVEEDEKLGQQIEDDLVNSLTPEMDPFVSYREARVIMTRPDYLIDHDRHNIVNINSHHQVRPDSRMMLTVFRRIAKEEGFDQDLQDVRDRVDQIESLHRTAELTVKKDDADLGGFLRLRVGEYRKEHDKPDADSDGGESGVGEVGARKQSVDEEEGARLV